MASIWAMKPCDAPGSVARDDEVVGGRVQLLGRDPAAALGVGGSVGDDPAAAAEGGA